MPDIQKTPEHVDPVALSIREHVPATGDIYITRSPGQYCDMYRLGEPDPEHPGRFRVTRLDPLTGEAGGDGEGYLRENISEGELKQYYRYLSGDLADILALARKVMAGDTDAVRRAVLGDEEDASALSEDTALTSGRTAREVGEMLLQAEVRQNQLQEIQMAAQLMMTARKNELERKLGAMTAVLGAFREKVRDLVRVVTILNLYLGKEVSLEQLTDGDPADPAEPLHLRQRILFMDEELCAHLDHEADYKDISLFFEWLKEPANRDIIVPEQRCIVAVKPKRFDMGYRSGDHWYDAQRELWNRHTYLVLRNGERLYAVDSDDLECWDWVFPHKDHESAFAEKMADPGRAFKDSLARDHKDENYRVMRFAMFVQGILDRGEVMGPMAGEPNLMKMQGVVLVRDDEDGLGTGLAPWKTFQEEKNALLRRGKRIVYIPSRGWRESATGPKYYDSGDYRRYYVNEGSKPGAPAEGIYSLRADSGNRVSRFWFSYLPGGTVWPKSCWEQEHDRRRYEGWTPSMRYVLNYDDTTSAELQAYFDDRSKRTEFREMMPILKRALLEKRREEADEDAFVKLMLHGLHDGDCCSGVTEADVRSAIAWWKEKVIFTRPLSKDDAKAWRMIRKRLEGGA